MSGKLKYDFTFANKKFAKKLKSLGGDVTSLLTYLDTAVITEINYVGENNVSFESLITGFGSTTVDLFGENMQVGNSLSGNVSAIGLTSANYGYIDVSEGELDIGNSEIVDLKSLYLDEDFFGTEFNDTIFGFEGEDYLRGKGGSDVLHGGVGNDTLAGGKGADNLTGGGGKDTLTGGKGNDKLFGHAGNDVLIGGLGNDQLTGGAGRDKFCIGTGAGRDVIKDYGTGNDRIKLLNGLEESDLTIRQAGDNVKIKYEGDLMAIVQDTLIADLTFI